MNPFNEIRPDATRLTEAEPPQARLNTQQTPNPEAQDPELLPLYTARYVDKGRYRISLRVLQDFDKGKKFQKREKRGNVL